MRIFLNKCNLLIRNKSRIQELHVHHLLCLLIFLLSFEFSIKIIFGCYKKLVYTLLRSLFSRRLLFKFDVCNCLCLFFNF